jgi:hypothetical protein
MMPPYLRVEYINKGQWILTDLVSYRIRNGLLTVVCNHRIGFKVKKLVTVIPLVNVLSIQRVPEQP